MIQKTLLALAIILSVSSLILWVTNSGTKSFGSVNYGSEYIGTTTKNGVNGTNNIASYTVISECTQALGSVIITGANTGIINIHNATTTGAHSDYSTSTSILASIPASAAAGTYTFDVRASKGGLVFELVSGLMPTTTITCR